LPKQPAQIHALIRRRLFLVNGLIGGAYAWPASLKAALLTLTTDHWLLAARM
jgi:hypothetical protein